MNFLLALVASLTFYFVGVLAINAGRRHSFKCKKEGKRHNVPEIRRCDFVYDCDNGIDEKNCTRHPGAGPPCPSEIADQWTQKSIWSRDLSNSPLLPVRSGKSSDPVYSLSLTYKRILNGTMFIENKNKSLFHATPPCNITTLSNAYYLLSSKLGEAYSWAKSTSGLVQDGAVVAGLSTDFQLTFLCRVPLVYLNRKGMRLDPSVGTVRPSTGVCSLPTIELRDYEILVHVENIAGFSCGIDAFHCAKLKQCIPSYFVCDGEPDCGDGSDENITLCRKVRKCQEEEFPCSDGKCIGMDKICEVDAWSQQSKENCYDGKDESKDTFEQFCQHDRFRCESGIFINLIDRCNSVDNCKDFSDEYNCSRYPSLRPAYPHQLEFRDWKKGWWVKSDHNFQPYFHEASGALKLLEYNDVQLQKSYFRRVQHMYGIFNLRCFNENDICNRFLMENGTVVKAKDTTFEIMQHAPEENQYDWVENAKGQVPDGAVMLGVTPAYEPVFICRQRSSLSWLNHNIYLGMLIPSQRSCHVIHKEYSDQLIQDDRLKTKQRFLDYEILRDSSYHGKSVDNNRFSCGSREEYIEPHLVCDGEWDCTDGEDEEIGNCRERNNCTSRQFPCSDGKCIPLNKSCQGRYEFYRNCLGGNDESPRTCPDKYECGKYEFKCKDGNCIYKSDVCNGVWNCKDGSDESSTCDEQICGPNRFQCKSGKCLSNMARCDSFFQCDDRSDEMACGMQECKPGILSEYFSCKKDPHKLDEIQLKQGLWIPSPIVLDQHVVLNRNIRFEDYSVCRIMDTLNGRSRTILGTLAYEHNIGRVVCVAGEILDASGAETLPFEILHEDTHAAYKWAEKFGVLVDVVGGEDFESTKKDPQYKFGNNLTDGIIIGGLTDEYEIIFICRPGDAYFFHVGSMRPRLNTCMKRTDYYTHYILLDTRYIS